MYEILLTQKFQTQLQKLTKEVQKRIISGLKKIQIRPHYFVKRIVGTNYFRLRVGEYRVILDINNKELIIYALEVGHRKNIYKE